MAQVQWKDIVWTGEDRELGIKELLTILKGYGPMEVLHFEKPSHYRGKIGVWLDEKGVRHITLYHLEVLGERRQGVGRQALQHLHNIFGGDVHVEDPGETVSSEEKAGGIHVSQPNRESAMFWIKMFTENLVQTVEGDIMNLDDNTSPSDLDKLIYKFSIEPEDDQKTTSLKYNSS
ncbi:MAG: hypothetical protein LJE89_07075 [Deltaproteobacteria bacterium]|nr:hypothetical protein [Deltaproteobacteria bacterium]